MSDQLAKPLLGQYSFLKSADRLATLKNLHVGGATVAISGTTGAATANAALGSNFTVTRDGNFTLTVTNLDDGQTIRVLVIATITGPVVVTVSPNDGDAVSSLASSAREVLTISKFGSLTYVSKYTVAS